MRAFRPKLAVMATPELAEQLAQRLGNLPVEVRSRQGRPAGCCHHGGGGYGDHRPWWAWWVWSPPWLPYKGESGLALPTKKPWYAPESW